MSFTEETSVVKFAGPVVSIDFDGHDDNGNYRYKVSFIPGHEFGDNRIDFNAGWKSKILKKNLKILKKTENFEKKLKIKKKIENFEKK